MFDISKHFDKLEIQPEMVIADFGCGVGASTVRLAQTFSNVIVCAVDIDRNTLDHLEANLTTQEESVKSRIKIIQADLEDEGTNPIPEQTFDVAVLENVLHSTTHRKALIWNLKLMLKDGARLLITDFHISPLKTSSHQQMLLNKQDVERLFVEAGFLVYPIDMEDAHSYAFLAKKPDGRKVSINHK